MCGEIAASFFSDRDRRSIVLDEAPRSGRQRTCIIIGDDDAGILHREPRGGTPHRHDRELPRERVEHLDGEPAFGPPRNPGKLACCVHALTGLLPVDATEVDGISER
jgi:hypothetical protein